MTAMSQGNKKITSRKVLATNKVLVHTGSLRFFKKYQPPITKFWLVLLPVRETVHINIYTNNYKYTYKYTNN